MCNFVPGECLIIGETHEITRLLSNWIFPCDWETISLVPDDSILDPKHPMRTFALAHITGIPDGLEILAISKLSSLFHEQISNNKAVVEPNIYIPLAAQPPRQRDNLTAPSIDIIQKIKNYFNVNRIAAPIRPVGMLDSGISITKLSESRPCRARDYSGSRRINFGRAIDGDDDPNNHGTRVCEILDASLPNNVAIASGKRLGNLLRGVKPELLCCGWLRHLQTLSPVRTQRL